MGQPLDVHDLISLVCLHCLHALHRVGVLEEPFCCDLVVLRPDGVSRRHCCAIPTGIQSVIWLLLARSRLRCCECPVHVRCVSLDRA